MVCINVFYGSVLVYIYDEGDGSCRRYTVYDNRAKNYIKVNGTYCTLHESLTL